MCGRHAFVVLSRKMTSLNVAFLRISDATRDFRILKLSGASVTYRSQIPTVTIFIVLMLGDQN